MLIVVGAVLASVILSDAVRTTINLTEQRGPIARAMLRLGRLMLHRLPHRYRTGAGVVITLMIVLSWTLGLWLAWTIALFDPSITIVHTTTGATAGGLDVVYAAGYSIFTLGTGDLTASTPVGRIVTVFAAGTGLFTVTMEVTYLVSLTTAAAHERKTARQAYAFGGDVLQVLERSWDGTSFRSAEPLLFGLADELGGLAEQHRTFPVLHDVLPTERRMALGPSLLGLADAVETMRHAVPAEQAIGPLPYRQVIDAMDALVEGLPPDSAVEDPPAPLAAGELLASVGVNAVAEPVCDARRAERRRSLYRLAHEEGWELAAVGAVRPQLAGS